MKNKFLRENLEVFHFIPRCIIRLRKVEKLRLRINSKLLTQVMWSLSRYWGASSSTEWIISILSVSLINCLSVSISFSLFSLLYSLYLSLSFRFFIYVYPSTYVPTWHFIRAYIHGYISLACRDLYIFVCMYSRIWIYVCVCECACVCVMSC